MARQDVEQRLEPLIALTSGLPALPASRVYEAWLIGPTGTREAGLLSQPSAPLVATDVRAGDQLGITIEPAGGTSKPTTKPIVLERA